MARRIFACARALVFALCVIVFVPANARAQSSNLAALAPPHCIAGGATYAPSALPRMPPGPLSDLTAYIVRDLATELRVSESATPMTTDGVLRYREFLGRMLSGDPADSAFHFTGEMAFGSPTTGESCGRAWALHVYELANDRRTLPLAEERLPAIAEALAQYNQDAYYVRGHTRAAQSIIDYAEGRYVSYATSIDEMRRESPLWMRPLLALAGFSAEDGRRNVSYATGVPIDRDADPRFIFNAYGSESVLDCRHVALFKLAFERQPQFRAAFPAMAARTDLCGQEETYSAHTERASYRDLSMQINATAQAVASIPGFQNWRQSALFDRAAALSEAGDDHARAVSLAGASAAARDGAADALTEGRTIYDPRLWNARLLSLRLAYEGATAAQQARLRDEFLAVSAHVPRSAADTAVRDLGVRLASADPQVDSALRAWRDASARAETASRIVAGAPNLAAGAAAARTLETLLGERRAAADRLERASPIVATQLRALDAPQVAGLQSALAPDEAILVLHTLPELSGAGLVVTKTTAQIVPLPLTRREAIAAATALRASVAWTDGRSRRFAADQAWRLYQGLIQPFETALGDARRLIIVPDAAVNDVPWPALVNAPPARDATPRYLINAYAVTVSTSPAAFLALRRMPPLAMNGAFTGVGAALSPATAPQGSALAGVGALPTLTSADIHVFGELFDGAKHILTGADATEARVTQTLSQSRDVIAFSTHGLFANEVRTLSEPALLLTPGDTTPRNDGLLTASEIASLRLETPLVLLTACNTATGDANPDAETLSGLVRAFQIAGARNVVATYWTASDGASEFLATQFGSALLERAPYSVALQRAQTAVALTPEFAHPHYWATFGFFGAD